MMNKNARKWIYPIDVDKSFIWDWSHHLHVETTEFLKRFVDSFKSVTDSIDLKNRNELCHKSRQRHKQYKFINIQEKWIWIRTWIWIWRWIRVFASDRSSDRPPCPSVRPSVRPTDRLTVGPSARPRNRRPSGRPTVNPNEKLNCFEMGPYERYRADIWRTRTYFAVPDYLKRSDARENTWPIPKAYPKD